ncbi:MAG: hypothetical protein HY721_05865 [Planctomycetes bacterium]|nr:hypothetical protein [Planctomycetota bacterium]
MRSTVVILLTWFTGCAGPARGFFAEHRGRTRLLEERADAHPAAAGSERSRVPLFPLLFVESGEGATAVEVLWPFFEAGSGGGEPPSSWFRLRPLLAFDSFRDGSRAIVFPVWFHLRERREAGDRSIDHLWPIYGLHREWIDLAPATTHHIAWPLFLARIGPGKHKVQLLPLFSVSSGYLDRGWWLFPPIKAGSHGRSAFFYLLDPLFAYERDSIAGPEEEERPEHFRVRWSLLGGLLAWEVDRGQGSVRLLWAMRL